MTSEPGKVCFFITPIGDEKTPARERADQMLEFILRPVLGPKGYKVVRADEISELGHVNRQVIEHLVETPLVVADLTSQNPNVFYELAIRHCFQKPVIHMIQVGEKIPFDVAHLRTIVFDITNIRSVEKCKVDLGKLVDSVEGTTDPPDSPVSAAIGYVNLRESYNPQDRADADILRYLEDISTKVTYLESDVRNRANPLFVTGGWLEPYSAGSARLGTTVRGGEWGRGYLTTFGGNSLLPTESDEPVGETRDEQAPEA